MLSLASAHVPSWRSLLTRASRAGCAAALLSRSSDSASCPAPPCALACWMPLGEVFTCTIWTMLLLPRSGYRVVRLPFAQQHTSNFVTRIIFPLHNSLAAADPELEFAIVIALYEPQRLMIPVLLRIRQRPRSDLVKGVHITGTPYASRQVMKGNNFGAISFDNVPVAADDVMSAFVSVDAAAPPSSRFVLAKGAAATPHAAQNFTTILYFVKGDTRAVYHVRLLNRLIVGRVLFPAAGMVMKKMITHQNKLSQQQ